MLYYYFVMFRWFHGKISREMAEDLLTPKENGLFLVRESTNYPGDYTLCVCYLGKVEHYRVKYKDNQLTIDDEEFFENLSQLVEVSRYFIINIYIHIKIVLKLCLCLGYNESYYINSTF